MATKGVNDYLYKTPIGVGNYCDYNNMPYNAGQQEDITVVLDPGSKKAAGIGAYNTKKPHFYRVALETRANIFPTAGAKSYYYRCLASVLPLYAVELEVLSVGGGAVNAVVATYDQAPISLRRYFARANEIYAAYCAETLGLSGTLFKSKVYYKRLKTLAEVASAINGVGVPQSDGITSLQAFSIAYGEAGRRALATAAPSQFDAIEKGKKKVKLHQVIEDVLIDYGCYAKRAIPNDIMSRVIASVVENSGENYDKVCDAMNISVEQRASLLTYVIAEYVMGLKCGYNEVVGKLQAAIPNEMKLKTELVVLIYKRLGYSIATIFKMLGFVYCVVADGVCYYPSDELVVSAVKQLAVDMNTNVEMSIHLFAVIDTFEDPNRVLNLAKKCRGEI